MTQTPDSKWRFKCEPCENAFPHIMQRNFFIPSKKKKDEEKISEFLPPTINKKINKHFTSTFVSKVVEQLIEKKKVKNQEREIERER